MLIAITAPQAEPVTLAEAKKQIGLVHDADDDRVSGAISAAREAVELFTGRALAAAQYQWTPAENALRAYRVPLHPVVSIDAVSTWIDGAEVALLASEYDFDPTRAKLGVSKGGSLSVTFTTDAPAVIPSALRSAMLMLISDLYENTEAGSDRAIQENPALSRMLFPHRVNLGA